MVEHRILATVRVLAWAGIPGLPAETAQVNRHMHTKLKGQNQGTSKEVARTKDGRERWGLWWGF